MNQHGGRSVWIEVLLTRTLVLLLNPAVGDSFLIMINLTTRHSWKAGTLLLFLFLLDLISSRLVY